MIESISERSQMIKEAVAIATGIDIQDFMVGNDCKKQQWARKVAIELYTNNLGFMGNRWITRQLGYDGESRHTKYLYGSRFGFEVYRRAQELYEKMVREANSK